MAKGLNDLQFLALFCYFLLEFCVEAKLVIFGWEIFKDGIISAGIYIVSARKSIFSLHYHFFYSFNHNGKN